MLKLLPTSKTRGKWIILEPGLVMMDTERMVEVELLDQKRKMNGAMTDTDKVAMTKTRGIREAIIIKNI